MVESYVARSVDPILTRLLAEVPAVLLTGPRATGKTTTAARHARSVLRLDRPAEAAGVESDPDAVLAGLPEPVLVDEWQVVPDVLGAIKRTVDRTPQPGRFIVTGSVRAELSSAGWPGTGRLLRVPMAGLTVREQGGVTAEPTTFLDQLTAGGTGSLKLPAEVPDLRGYLELALASGFPEATFTSSPDVRRRWLRSYVEQLLTRDAVELAGRRDPALLGRFTETLALHSAGTVRDSELAVGAGISAPTAASYERLLQNLLVIDSIPAWWSNRIKRLTRAPKRYLVDAGLLAAILRVDANGLLRDGDLLGRFLDTFVTSQLRAELVLSPQEPLLFHLRQEKGAHEVDLVSEFGGGRVVAIEIKARAAPRPEDAQHLRWLRDELGEKFLAGVLLHTGPHVIELDDRLVAAPICAVWG